MNGPQPEPTVQVPITKTVMFTGVQVNAGHAPDGSRVLQIIDPGSATIYSLSLSAEAAREIGKTLISAVPIATPDQMPGGANGGAG